MTPFDRTNEPTNPGARVIHDLAVRLIASVDRKRLTPGGEFRSGKLSVFNTSMGVTVRLFQPSNVNRVPPHDLVYSWVMNYIAVVPRPVQDPDHPYVVGTYNPNLAEEAIELIKRELVLEELARI